MSYDPARVLKIFFDIEPATIRADLRKANEDNSEFKKELSSLMNTLDEAKTSEDWTRQAHLWMVQANRFQHDEQAETEAKVYMAVNASLHITCHAHRDAEKKDPLKGLWLEMHAICKHLESAGRQSTTHDADLAHYSRVRAEYWAHLEKVDDIYFTTVLERYGLEKVSALFDSDRKEYAIQREVGRHLLNQAPPEDHPASKEITAGLVHRFGEGVPKVVSDRVAQIRANRPQAAKQAGL
jgi:hypothetical protein